MASPSSIATLTAADLGGEASVLTRQRPDHEALEETLEHLEGASPDDQPPLLRRIWRLAFSHAFAEEAVLWPALRRTVDGGEELTLRVEEEHQEISALASELERMRPTDEAWWGAPLDHRPVIEARHLVALARSVDERADRFVGVRGTHQRADPSGPQAPATGSASEWRSRWFARRHGGTAPPTAGRTAWGGGVGGGT